MAKGKKALFRKRRDKRQGKQALYIGIGITILLIALIFFLTAKDF
ncbi:MAG: hypothetical protein V3V00_06315 [Saprospiraceae bacterium]